MLTVILFAWFAADAAATLTTLTNNASENIGVVKNATVGGIDMRLAVVWPESFTRVDLTAGAEVAASGENVKQEVGNSYVIDQSGHIKANTATVTKIATVSFTLADRVGSNHGIETKKADNTWRDATDAEVALLLNKTLTVKVTGTGQLRVSGAADDSDLTNGAVGASSSYTGVAQNVGTAKVKSVTSGVIEWEYDSLFDINGATADAGLNFRYSVTPKDTSSTGDYEYNNATPTASNKEYGTFSVTLNAAV